MIACVWSSFWPHRARRGTDIAGRSPSSGSTETGSVNTVTARGHPVSLCGSGIRTVEGVRPVRSVSGLCRSTGPPSALRSASTETGERGEGVVEIREMVEGEH